VTVLATLLQVFWKKVFHKKLFRVAPIHHHFEALGWPETKVTMRFWILGQVASFAGLMIFIIGNYHV
jgi:phospho-N-acetylmuramoyl-pentapeptide-transferase